MSLQVENARGQETTPPPTRSGHLKDKVRSLRIKESPRRTGGGRGLPWFLCLLASAAAGYLGWQVYELKQNAAGSDGTSVVSVQSSGQAAGSPAATSSGSLASAGSVADSGGVVHESKGYLLPTHQILISPKVGGMVKNLKVHGPHDPPDSGEPLIEGMQVRKGDILAELETTDYDADVVHSQANLERARLKLEMEQKNVPREIDRAKAELDEAISLRNFYKTQLDRWNKLSRTSTVSPSDLEKAESDFVSAGHRVERLKQALDLIIEPQEQRLKVAEADVAAAESDLTKALWKRGNTVIISPVNGTVLKKNVEEGNIVNPGAFNGSYSICDLADLSDLEVELDIQERDISRIFVGQRCTVRAEAFQDQPYEGFVSRLMPIANRSKGAIPVRVKVKIPPGMEGVHLKPEMGAIVAFYKKTDADPQLSEPTEPPGNSPEPAEGEAAEADFAPTTDSAPGV